MLGHEELTPNALHAELRMLIAGSRQRLAVP